MFPKPTAHLPRAILHMVLPAEVDIPLSVNGRCVWLMARAHCQNLPGRKKASQCPAVKLEFFKFCWGSGGGYEERGILGARLLLSVWQDTCNLCKDPRLRCALAPPKRGGGWSWPPSPLVGEMWGRPLHLSSCFLIILILRYWDHTH